MIKFGTDGWRAIIGKDFTFENVKIVTQALIEYARAHGLDKNGIAVGYDNRFESEHFARTAAEVCAANGLKTFLTQEALPSPTLSFYVKNNNLDLGIMITASHNPAEWNGFKIKENFGGSARPQVTQAVEKLIGKTKVKTYDKQKIETFDPKPEYFKYLRTLVDFDLIKNKKIKVAFDPMYGSGAGYLSKLGLKVDEIHGFRDPLFGGLHPEPLPIYLDDLTSQVKELSDKYLSEYVLGIAVDGDADRIAGIDEKGNYLSSHNIFCLLLRHLLFTGK